MAMALIALAAALGLFVTPGLLAQNDDITRLMASQPPTAREASNNTKQLAQGTGTLLPLSPDANFYGLLIDEQAFDRPVQQLFLLAQQNQLTLSDMTYRYAPNTDGQFLEMSIETPLKGSYAQIVQFCESVLSSMPYVALDTIDVKREHVGSSEVEARVRFVLYLKPSTHGAVATSS